MEGSERTENGAIIVISGSSSKIILSWEILLILITNWRNYFEILLVILYFSSAVSY